MKLSGALYSEGASFFHRLDGSVKFTAMLGWTVFVFLFMDVRIFTGMIILGLLLLTLAKLPFQTLRPLFGFMAGYTLFNALLVLLTTPEYGSQIARQHTLLWQIGNLPITAETLFYCFTLALKYFAILPITLLVILTTHPGRLASSLNRVGVPYKVAYAVNIALRYLPDVKTELRQIMHAQAARGVAFRRGEAGMIQRLRNYGVILIPLLITSLNRIEVISNAMDLRGFGRAKTRTWYNQRPLTGADWIALGCVAALVISGFWFKHQWSSGFWYPF